MKSQNYKYMQFAKFLKDKFINEITGEILPEEPFLKAPEDNVLIGMLKGVKETRSVLKENISKTKLFQSFTSITLKVKIKANSKLTVVPTGYVFYTVKPTYELYKETVNESKIKGELIEIKPAFKKVDLSKIYGKTEVILDGSEKDFYEIMLNKMEKFCSNISDGATFEGRIKISPDEVKNELDFDKLVNSRIIKTKPNWNIEIKIDKANSEDDIIVNLNMFNKTEVVVGKSPFDGTIYNAGIMVIAPESNFKKFKLNQFKKGYKNDVEVFAIPENADYSAFLKDDKLHVKTINVPVFESKRLKTNRDFDKFIRFEDLIKNPIDNLEKIIEELKNYSKIKEIETTKILSSSENNEYKARLDEEISLLKSEVMRIELGLKILKKNSVIRKAFELLNITFKTEVSHKTAYDGWRLFQIGFIMTQIPYIIGKNIENDYRNHIRNYEDFVDVIYFPTGGGKTEAFLGATTLAMFYDRLKGKSIGVTSIIKYPLRLLSVQQLDRILLLLHKANLVKAENQINGDDFSVGYFVGSSNTPNLIKIDEATQFNNGFKDPNVLKVIDNCPSCGENKVNCIFDSEKHLLKHKCSKCNYDLPIYIVDDEIYRFLPTIIVSTVDKFANIGINSEFKLLLGQGENYCKQHGFSLKSCKYCGIENKIEIMDPVPTFLIQDELHLVRESLGTYASHYLHFLIFFASKLVKDKDRKSMKIIGSTATITNYKEHAYNLYGKNSIIFPCWLENANMYTYVDEEDISRYIIGFALHGRSISDGIQQANRILREILYNLWSNPDSSILELENYDFIVSKEELRQMVQNYWISIIYHNSKKDSIDLDNAFEIANDYLNAKKIPTYNLARITGDTNFTEIKEVLFTIQSEKNKFIVPNLISATSSISHGVDEDSFNQIFFNGMPSNSAEYIQAFSRVGRKYTGFVFDVFRLARERDFSYLKNFTVYHHFKDRLIEPVPINKWAKNAIFRTLPGILNAYIIQVLGSEYYYAIKLKKYILSNTDLKLSIINNLINIYGGIDNSKDSKYYSDVITQELNSFFDELLMMNDSKVPVKELIAKSFSHYLLPMSSLRDVDEQLKVEMVD